MKLIEALKEYKYQLKKADELKLKISAHCADLDCETPVYPNQREKIESWIQSHNDSLKRAAYLNQCILKTNTLTLITIEIDSVSIQKSISEWILRRKKLIAIEEGMWKSLGDKGLREGMINQSNGQPIQVKIRRYYDPSQKDRKLFSLAEEPRLIDSKLEIANCVTDLIE